MTITITAFAASPDRGRGQARDMRVRWALEEVGQPYDVRLLSFAVMKQPAHMALQPFGQIPTYEDGDVTLFESGAIVLHIAEQFPGLLPEDRAARARVINWIFAAQATVEPVIIDMETAHFEESDQDWHADRLPLMEARISKRLQQLSARLGEADWLDGDFSAGDLVMVGVLRRLQGSPLLTAFENLNRYVARGESRPAFQRAFAAQLEVFEAQQARP